MRLIAIATIAAFVVLGCGKDDTKDSFFPDDATLVVPTPEETAQSSSSLTRGLCASDSRAYNQVLEAIDEYNEEIEAQITLVKAMLRTAGRKAKRELDTNGVFEKTVTSSGGRSLTLKLTVEADDSVSYTLTFNGPNVTEYELIAGNAAADKSAGTWTFKKQNGDTIVTVTWTLTGDDLTVTRTNAITMSTVTYTRVGTTATVVAVGKRHTGTITWDTMTKAGSIMIDMRPALCWNAELCTTPCN